MKKQTGRSDLIFFVFEGETKMIADIFQLEKDPILQENILMKQDMPRGARGGAGRS